MSTESTGVDAPARIVARYNDGLGSHGGVLVVLDPVLPIYLLRVRLPPLRIRAPEAIAFFKCQYDPTGVIDTHVVSEDAVVIADDVTASASQNDVDAVRVAARRLGRSGYSAKTDS